jgi:hypothetical protein
VIPVIQDISVGVGLLVVLMVAFEIGYSIGRRVAFESDPRSAGQVGAIQGAILGLLGLLLAFSFAAAGSRFLEKQDLIASEANAIGTAYLRADLLDEPHASELRGALRKYVEHRIEASGRLRGGLSAADAAEIEKLHAAIWSAAVAGARAQPAAALAVVTPVNEVLDLHSTRVAAGKKHVPMLVLGLLIACSLLALGAIGYGSGIGQHRRAPLTVSLSLLVAAALWITIDLDHPRAGLLQLSDAPLKELKLQETGP